MFRVCQGTQTLAMADEANSHLVPDSTLNLTLSRSTQAFFPGHLAQGICHSSSFHVHHFNVYAIEHYLGFALNEVHNLQIVLKSQYDKNHGKKGAKVNKAILIIKGDT